MNDLSPAARAYSRYLLVIAGLGGLLYGIGYGVIAASMPYIKALGIFTDTQVSLVVGAMMFGGILSSLTAGVLAERAGRRRIIIFSPALFLAAVPVVCLSGGSLSVMLAGRVLQGMSCGYMSVVMPMYLAECLDAGSRGRGTGVFQLLLCIGLVLAAAVGLLVARVYGAADAPADLVTGAAKTAAWQINFWWTMAPVSVFFAMSFRLKESPRWLYRRGRRDEALASLTANNSEAQARAILAEMDASDAAVPTGGTADTPPRDSLLSRKYVVPFLLTVLVLTLNKTIGMSSILSYSVSIFHKAGFAGSLGNAGDFTLKTVNLAMTAVAVLLVDRKGRTWLLKLGTAGLTAGLAAMGCVFLAIERFGVAATPVTGSAVLVSALFMQAFYALGPGVCVWLVLSELLPTRIRANGMAIALFANQFTSWGLASSFFPMMNAWGYGPVFLAFAASGALYYLTVLFIPETKGRSLEEIEAHFASARGTRAGKQQIAGNR